MEASVGAPPQRVCPKCARLSWATGPRCPYCRARFSRRTTATIAWMLTAAVIVILGGTLAMFLVAGQVYQDRLDERVAEVQRNFDATVNRLRTDFQAQLDQRLPPAGAVPSPTPTATATPEGQPTPTPTPTPSPTATSSP